MVLGSQMTSHFWNQDQLLHLEVPLVNLEDLSQSRLKVLKMMLVYLMNLTIRILPMLAIIGHQQNLSRRKNY